MTTRVERARMPLARDVLRAVAEEHGVCVRPVAVRRTDVLTGETEIIDIPCGATRASLCPTCAERKRRLRAVQCREGWHLTEEPALEADPATDEQRFLTELRADLTKAHSTATGTEADELASLILDVDEQLADSGARGTLAPTATARRVRSTRRRQDTPDLPRRPVEARTLGKAYTTPDGRAFRPSLFLTLTLPSYGRVRADGTPADPARYDYRHAARDALHFSKLVDRFIQNLRRFVGYDVQYFAVVEPQRRLAPHLHLALRGTISRAELRQVVAATYHQVWWPPCDQPRYTRATAPLWSPEHDGYLDPATGSPLPTWDQALDGLDADPDAEPLHVARFGSQLDAQGVLIGSPQAGRCIRYLTKYLTKSVAECHTSAGDSEQTHVDRLAAALEQEPCSPTCANWLLHGIQPKNAHPGLRAGACRAKAHKREHLGYGGRRVLVSRKWSGKTLADHRTERRAWVLDLLGQSGPPPDPHRYLWAVVRPGDPDTSPLAARLLRAVAERVRWRTALDQARAQAEGHAVATIHPERKAA
ncbi:replication initiator [Kitasatospora mediocidica]|uniref:replication initiator n=1 Tax=Kitasatospora mediocidica TaxID=58352 RepID=UPI000568D408|nr:replication initiator [Kitasatospora mediocidica]